VIVPGHGLGHRAGVSDDVLDYLRFTLHRAYADLTGTAEQRGRSIDVMGRRRT
jgi:hypothetical protein